MGWRPEDATVSVIELVEEGVGTLMTMTQTYPSQAVRDQTLNFMETQPGASGADGYDRLAEMVEERESDSEDVEVRLLPVQPMISIRATVKVADLAATMEDRLSALREYLERHGVRPAGAPFVRYHTFPDIGPDTEGVGDLETDVEEGIPVAEALPGEGRIASGELPVGPVVTTCTSGCRRASVRRMRALVPGCRSTGRSRRARPGRSTISLTSSDSRGTRACPTARRGATASCNRSSRTAAPPRPTVM